MLIIKTQAMWKNVTKKGENDPDLCAPRNHHEGFKNFKDRSEYVCKQRGRQRKIFHKYEMTSYVNLLEMSTVILLKFNVKNEPKTMTRTDECSCSAISINS